MPRWRTRKTRQKPTMSTQDTVGCEADDTWRPPTHGASKLLWYMTAEEFDQLRQGTLSLDTVESRIKKRERGQRPLTDFSGGDL